MTATPTVKNWLENTLEKPFFAAEMARVEMMKARPGEENTNVITWLAVYAAGYLALCSYWTVKYLF